MALPVVGFRATVQSKCVLPGLPSPFSAQLDMEPMLDILRRCHCREASATTSPGRRSPRDNSILADAFVVSSQSRPAGTSAQPAHQKQLEALEVSGSGRIGVLSVLAVSRGLILKRRGSQCRIETRGGWQGEGLFSRVHGSVLKIFMNSYGDCIITPCC